MARRTTRRRDVPYTVRIIPTFGIQADVKAWHNPSGDVVLDVAVWRPNVRKHAEAIARAACARDAAERRTAARKRKEEGLDSTRKRRA